MYDVVRLYVSFEKGEKVQKHKCVVTTKHCPLICPKHLLFDK